ncbi:hypothetical protein [Flammeovirga pacifica]|uniref:Uncharacterized protein n=1 Tax=Flammeovirga pacifica TaxID=915059 RepID=A0A1S1YYN4_FLAPC|nr:hypothetical protein [Flammeovirga pacifica]OHX66112.1 hypothetical protein NH26_06990 [Flammeovirga pacifica]
MTHIITLLTALILMVLGSIKFTSIYRYLGLIKFEAVSLSVVTSFLLIVIFAKIIKELIDIFAY